MAIIVKELSHIYAPEMPYAFRAINDINLEIQEGKITAIIGETGSGKSTLVQHFNALLLPSSGELEIFEHHVYANEKNKGLKALRKDVGLVFQFSEYQLFEETILKDVAFGPKNFGCSEEEALLKAQKALKLVGLDESFYERSPLDLSGGQKRRVAIAGILAMEPKMIVLDEPTAGLDPKGAKEMIELFCSLNKEAKVTVLLVSHDNEVVYHHTDEVVLMKKGEIVYHGPTQEFFKNENYLEEFNLLPPMELSFKKALEAVGFDVKDCNLEEMVNKIAKEVKR